MRVPQDNLVAIQQPRLVEHIARKLKLKLGMESVIEQFLNEIDGAQFGDQIPARFTRALGLRLREQRRQEPRRDRQ